jgi:hypothetical protein
MFNGSLGLRMFCVVAMAAAILLGCVRPAACQLAITEVMSSASRTLGTNSSLTSLSDYWELTNFGTEPIDLNGYRWNDNLGGLYGNDVKSLDGLGIAPGESILFVQADGLLTNALGFLEWWGNSLPPNLQIVIYDGNGLSGNGDGIRLWGPNATGNADVIDSVDFGTASRGQSFTYEPATGVFGKLSVEGVDGAFKAATRDDVGSPGFTTGSVPLQILSQPTDLSVCSGIDAIFVVKVGGWPRPAYQWFHDGEAVPGATSARLTVANPQSLDAGNYQVEVNSGAVTLGSDVASLSVSSDPTAPTILIPFTDVSVLVGETARFFTPVCAFPPPTFVWSTNGVAMALETNRALVLANVSEELSGTVCCVQITNTIGTTNLCARLIVTPKPNLQITEVMGWASTNCLAVERADWFELTNFDTFAVNLRGYRFARLNGSLKWAFDDARVVDQDVVLQPGRSVIFSRDLSPAQFVLWWGAELLPPDLQIVTFTGMGLDSLGETLQFWSPGAVQPEDTITATGFAAFDNGVSQRFDCSDPDDPACYAGVNSVSGEHGAFRAAQCDDLGSPGYTANPLPRLVSLSSDGPNVSVKWRSVVGKTYQFKWKSHLGQATWTLLSTHTATDWVQTATDTTVSAEQQKFYLIEELP